MTLIASMKHLAILLMTTVLFGCAGAVVESARMTNDAATRDKYLTAAQQGDSEAQYLVGKSFCCAPSNDADGFYNNRKATEFLCKAARQNHPAAAFQIAKIHSGDTVDGVRLLRRAANLVRGETLDNRVVAYYWYTVAAKNGHSEAMSTLNKLEKQDISQYNSPLTTPCSLDDLYEASQ